MRDLPNELRSVKNIGVMSDPQTPVVNPPPEVSPTVHPSYTSILHEHDVSEKQRQTRVGLLKEMEKKEFNGGKGPNAVIAHVSKEGSLGSSLEAGDIPVLGIVLRSIGDVQTLSLILHSPGGDGTCVEKVVALCRAQCKHFRVIIPNRAKSAATMIALGADEILMGPSSEIGPIDAQVPVVIEGIPRYVSAQSFIDARDALLKRYKEALEKKEDPQPILQMIASLDIPFIEECQRMMDFGRDVVRELLGKYMFARDKAKDAKIDKIVEMLSSVKKHKVHGRFISGNTAKRELKLSVRLLAKDDPLWQSVWEYYTRTDINLGRIRSAKMFETRHEMLHAVGQ
jgi:ClpP class serine protease